MIWVENNGKKPKIALTSSLKGSENQQLLPLTYHPQPHAMSNGLFVEHYEDPVSEAT